MNNSSICRAITAADILRLEVAKTKTKSNPQPLGLKSVIDLLLYLSLVPRDSSRIQVMGYATKNRKFETRPLCNAFSHHLQLCHILLLLGENGKERECKSIICKEEGRGESFNFLA